MTDDHDGLHRLIDRAAASAPPLRADPRALVALVRRRRRRRGALLGSAAALVAAAAAGTALAGLPGSGSAATATPGTGTAVAGVCGAPAPTGTDPGPPAAVSLTITGVRGHGSGQPPTVEVAVGADRTAKVVPTDVVALQVLVLHDGTVVDRIGGAALPDGAPSGEVAPAIGRQWEVSPASPHHEQVAPARATRCPYADWSLIWASPADYRLVAVMSEPRVYDANGPVPPTATTPSDPLLTSAPRPLGN